MTYEDMIVALEVQKQQCEKQQSQVVNPTPITKHDIVKNSANLKPSTKKKQKDVSHIPPTSKKPKAFMIC